MATRSRDRYRPVESRPTLGGQLITRGSSDNAGYLNYTLKRDWRRDLEVEIRREGVDYFWPNLTLPIAGQPFPGQILIDSLTRSGNVATATKLDGHHFITGETVVIASAGVAAYNGNHTLTAVTATTFSFNITGSPTTPDPSTTITAAPVEVINLIALARRPNGQTAVIAGSQRRLYRYFALTEGDYISRDSADYPPGTAPDQLSYWSDGTLFPADAAFYPVGTPVNQQQYIDTNPGYWIVIGSGFTPGAKRWEVESINGYMIFNNAVDLLMTYRVEDYEVVPIWELREQGVLSVETISAINGILMLADITEIRASYLANWFLTAADPYGPYPRPIETDRTTFRVMWGTPDEPRIWDVLLPVTTTAGSRNVMLGFPARSLVPGKKVTIVGAGTPHAGGTADNLLATIVNVAGLSVVLDVPALTAVANAVMESQDTELSIVGFENLQDDGSGIIKMLPLADILVIYKDTSIFLCKYLGDPAAPFGFTKRTIQKEESVFYRHTLIMAQTPNETFHIYAGRNAFYRFDLTSQQPLLLPRFELCSNTFFDQASLALTEQIFACDNGITHEIYFCFPSQGAEKGLAWDVKQDSLSTLGMVLTAGATIRKPVAGLASGAEEDWMLFGTAVGSVVIYGRTNINQSLPDWQGGREIYYRRYANPYATAKEPYDSVMFYGKSAMGWDFFEKDLRTLVFLYASQSPGTQLIASIYGTTNANRPVTLIGTKTFTDPTIENAMQLMARKNLFQLSLTVSGIDNPMRLVGVIWDVAPVDSRSATRS